MQTPTAPYYVTDDFYLCMKVAKLGWKFLAHGGVLPLHVDDGNRAWALPAGTWPTLPKETIVTGIIVGETSTPEAAKEAVTV